MLDMEIILEDGSAWSGFGKGGTAQGEVVFTTASSGYPQALSDPSFAGQILVFAFPMVGNYGVDEEALESSRPWVRAIVVDSLEDGRSRGTSLGEWLSLFDIPFMRGVDTRSMIRHIRSKGALMGCIGPSGEGCAVMRKEKGHPARDVSISKTEVFEGAGPTIVVVDYGLKHGIQRELSARGCRVVKVPHDTSAAGILSWNPDGVLLGNGPGDPSLLKEETEVVRALLGKIPLGGICLGLQVIALASGASTYKLPFGHRGANHAVMECAGGRAFVTSQNHGYAVLDDSLERTGLDITHRNLGDGSVEGLKSRDMRIVAVQYHPEGAPGPRDDDRFFEEFLSMCDKGATL